MNGDNLKYLLSRTDEKGLLHIGLGDWCHTGRETPKAPLEVTDTIISMDIATKMAFLFGAVGLKEKEALQLQRFPYKLPSMYHLSNSFLLLLISFYFITIPLLSTLNKYGAVALTD